MDLLTNMVGGMQPSLHNWMNQWRWKKRKRIFGIQLHHSSEALLQNEDVFCYNVCLQESEPHPLSSVGIGPFYQCGKHLVVFYRNRTQFTLDRNWRSTQQASGVVGGWHISSTQARSPLLSIGGCMKSLLDKSCGVTCMNWRARDWFFSRRIQTSAMDRFCWDCLRRNLVTTSPKCVTHAPSKLTSPSLRDATLFDIERCWDTLTDTDKVWKGHLETLGDNERQEETRRDFEKLWIWKSVTNQPTDRTNSRDGVASKNIVYIIGVNKFFYL